MPCPAPVGLPHMPSMGSQTTFCFRARHAVPRPGWFAAYAFHGQSNHVLFSGTACRAPPRLVCRICLPWAVKPRFVFGHGMPCPAPVGLPHMPSMGSQTTFCFRARHAVPRPGWFAAYAFHGQSNHVLFSGTACRAPPRLVCRICLPWAVKPRFVFGHGMPCPAPVGLPHMPSMGSQTTFCFRARHAVPRPGWFAAYAFHGRSKRILFRGPACRVLRSRRRRGVSCRP